MRISTQFGVILSFAKLRHKTQNFGKTATQNCNCIISGIFSYQIRLKSKKGFVITAAVLAAITAASFSIWFIPQDTQTKIIISNPKDELDALIDQQKTITESDKEEFERMVSGQITPDNYIMIADVSSSQIRAMIISITEPNVSQEWLTSYSALAESLRAYNTYLREAVVVAEKLKADPAADISEERAKLDQYLAQAQEFIAASNSARPA